MAATYLAVGYVFADMRWKQTIVGVGAVLLLATACGQQVQSSGGIEPAGRGPASHELTKMPGRKPAQPPTSEAGTPAKGTPVSKGQVDGSALPEGYPVDVSVLPDGRTLTVVGQEGGCSRASAELTGQTGERVAVRMVETKPVSKDIACTMDMRYPPLTVRLDQPLGEREVVLSYVERRT